MERKPIEDAIEELKSNLNTVARVNEWAQLMGYKSTKLFSRHFLRKYRCRPSEILMQIRLKSIITMIRRNDKSCTEIAWKHSLPDEKALNSYTNRHFGIPPKKIKNMSARKLRKKIENSWSKHKE
jgi:transcriptional regulator GlxA family with amidase domain